MSNSTTKSSLCYVYLIYADGDKLLKIGLTNDMERRWRELRKGQQRRLVVQYAMQVANSDDAFRLESALHQRFNRNCKGGEWFEIDALSVIGYVMLNPDLEGLVMRVIEYPEWLVIKPQTANTISEIELAAGDATKKFTTYFLLGLIIWHFYLMFVLWDAWRNPNIIWWEAVVYVVISAVTVFVDWSWVTIGLRQRPDRESEE